MSTTGRRPGIGAGAVDVLTGGGAAAARPTSQRPQRPRGGDNDLSGSAGPGSVAAAPVATAAAAATVSETASAVLDQRKSSAPAGDRPPRIPVEEIAFDERNDPTRHAPDADVSDIADTITSGDPRRDVEIALVIVEAKVYLTYYGQYAEQIGGKKWVVIDGNRRLRAAINKKFVDVPVILDNNKVGGGRDSRVRVIANIKRKVYSPIAEAIEYRRAMEEEGLDQEGVAALIETSGANVSRKLALLDLPEPVQVWVARGDISVANGNELAKHNADPQLQLAAANLLIDKRGGKDATSALRRAKADRTPPKDRDGSVDDPRAIAFAARDAVCISLINRLKSDEAIVDVDSLNRFIVRGPSRKLTDALALAHQWMLEAGLGSPIDELAPFVSDTLLNPKTLRIFAFAVALADEEVHARNERKKTWDARAYNHHRHLMEAGYASGKWDSDRLPPV